MRFFSSLILYFHGLSYICHIFRSIIGMYLLCDESINKLYLCVCAKERQRKRENEKGQNEMNAENIFSAIAIFEGIDLSACIFLYFCYRIEGSIGRQ